MDAVQPKVKLFAPLSSGLPMKQLAMQPILGQRPREPANDKQPERRWNRNPGADNAVREPKKRDGYEQQRHGREVNARKEVEVIILQNAWRFGSLEEHASPCAVPPLSRCAELPQAHLHGCSY